MDNKEQYVDFDTAKLLKKKGFNWRVHANYPVIGEYIGKRQYLTNSVLRDTPRGTDFNLDDGAWISCPTQAMVCRWLREVHKLDIIIFHERLGNDFYWARIETFPYVEHQQEKEYATWEESCEAAIKYCLEKLV